MAGLVFALAAWQAVLISLLFAVMYVGSLYVWTSTMIKNRDHPDTIKRRFLSVGVVSLLVPPILWMFGEYSEADEGHGLLSWLGIRFWGFLPSLFLPLILTMILFMGPLALHYIDGVFQLYLQPRYWTQSLSNWVWIRNHIVAPFSEEFIFRACMLPILVPAFGPGYSIFLCPLFFGVAHFHHMIEKVIQGQQDVMDALKQSAFQLFYTTIFGAYSAFLFMRTGHLIAPVIAHAFCNHMGFPAFSEVRGYQEPTRTKLMVFFVAGMILWLIFLYPMTSPWLYSNNVYTVWHTLA